MTNPIKGYNDKKYTDFAKESYSWKYIEKPTMIKLLEGKINNATKVLDAGCGEGRSIELVLGMGAIESNIVGIDLSQQLLDKLKSSFPGVRVVLGNFSEELENNFGDSFDLITSNMVMDYLSDVEFDSAVKNCFKWLRKGGYFMFGLPHPVREVVKINDLSHYLDREEWKDTTPWGDEVEYNHRPVSDYINVLIRNGLIIVSVEEPMINGEGKEDLINYKNYSATPSRLFVLAKK